MASALAADAMATGKRVVVLSGFHDYRTPRRASIQPLADACARLGHHVSFVSTRFSRLSLRAGDSRSFLWDRANKIETIEGVDCYLWKTPFHPFAAQNAIISACTGELFPWFARLPNATFDRIMRAADYVIIESSVAAIYVPRIRRLNPRCRIIYFATDRLDTHGAHPRVQQELIAAAPMIDYFALRSTALASEFQWAKDRLYRASFGIHAGDFADIGPSPYGARPVGVSVGSGLFDSDFFVRVAPHFPEVDFHVIGCGQKFTAPANVHVQPEMRFQDTLAWLKHATFGIAPYVYAVGAEYVAESSLKLAQFEYLRLPAVTAEFAVGGSANRWGYEIGSTASMCRAVRAALDHAGKIVPRHFPSWEEVAAQVLEPELYPETRIVPA